jgi:hypothetical protein
LGGRGWWWTAPKVRELRAAGYSLPAIAREMNLALTTVARICKQAA